MIREANESDLKDILEIYNDAILNTTAIYIYEVQTIEDKKKWFSQKRQDGYPVLVFEEDGKVVGFASFGPFRNYPAYQYTIEHSVYVHKDYRHKKIATKLMKELINIAYERGYATLVAGIDSSNTGSIKIHENLGFKYSGTISKAGFKFERWLDLVFYQLDLKGPEKTITDGADTLSN